MGVGARRAGRGGIRAGVDDGVEVEGLETFELTEGVAVVALGGINGALEAAEGAITVEERLAERSVVVGVVGGIDFVGPDLGFGGAEAAEGPDGADQDIDLIALGGGDGAVAGEVLFGEGGELRGIFAGNDEGLGVEAGFQGIHGGAGLTLGGAGAGGGMAWGAIGGDWSRFRHKEVCGKDGGRKGRPCGWRCFPTPGSHGGLRIKGVSGVKVLKRERR
jgi:hypothetical protein